MKILYLINSLNYIGGIERVTINKANTLCDMGHSVTIAVTDNDPSKKMVQPLSSNVNLHDFAINYYKDENSFFAQCKKKIKHYISLKNLVKRWKPDVIVSVGQSEKYILSLVRTNAIKIREIHFLSSYRKYTYNKKWLAKILDFIDYKFNIYRYDNYVLLTNEDLQEHWRYSRKRISVISNPLTISPIISDTKNKIITTVCRLSNRSKNLTDMINAFSLIHEYHPNWQLKIYGEGPDRKDLTTQIKSLGLQNNIILAGYTDNIAGVLSEASIYISTSNYEGLPLSIIEAISCGLPVVTYQFPVGAKEILEGTNAGFIVPMYDIKTLASKICYLIENESIRKEMSFNAVKRSKDFEITNIVNQWIDLFNKLIEQKNR